MTIDFSTMNLHVDCLEPTPLRERADWHARRANTVTASGSEGDVYRAKHRARHDALRAVATTVETFPGRGRVLCSVLEGACELLRRTAYESSERALRQGQAGQLSERVLAMSLRSYLETYGECLGLAYTTKWQADMSELPESPLEPEKQGCSGE